MRKSTMRTYIETLENENKRLRIRNDKLARALTNSKTQYSDLKFEYDKEKDRNNQIQEWYDGVIEKLTREE